jgi:hypothetical protein
MIETGSAKPDITETVTEMYDAAAKAFGEEMIILGENLSDREMLNQIVKEITALRKSHEEILAVVQGFSDGTHPLMLSFMNSPIAKMLGVKP